MHRSWKVSIVIPVFNGAEFVREAIDSALAQTYRNTEVLVVNDGSTDDGATERIARSYGDRIRYFSKPNGGVASALNRAILEMTGDYFSWLSHDDLYTPDKIERQVDALSRLNDHRKIIYSDYSVFTTNPDKAIPVRLKGVRPEHFRYWITIENSLHGCTLLLPRSAFVECGIFNESLRTTQDYDLWFRMAKKYQFVHIPDVLVFARSHSGQGSISMARTALQECNALLSGFVRELQDSELADATDEAPSVAYAAIAASMWYRGFRDAARTAARLSLRKMATGSIRDTAAAVRLLAKGVVQGATMRLTRPLVGPTLRRKLRTLLSPEKKALFPRVEQDSQSLQQKFSEIYEKNIFGGRISRSGEGSDLVQTAVIRRELPKLLRDLDVRSFLDAPCGDWCWMQHTELGVENYIGIDIVKALIDKNQREFGRPGTSFRCMNLAEGELPKVDLIFSRDCLVHLSFVNALRIIANFKRSGSKYLLTTTFTDRERNNDLIGKDSFWRPLNMQRPPFNFPPPVLLINEGCTEEASQFNDKCLGLWRLQDIECR